MSSHTTYKNHETAVSYHFAGLEASNDVSNHNDDR